MKSIHTEVLSAARGYFDAFFKVSPERVREHFEPDASKAGFMYDYEYARFLPLARHGVEQIAEWASQYNASGHMPASEPSLEVLDLQDRTAVVKLVAEWAPGRSGVDYILLVRPAGQWRISHILWQSVP